MTGRRTALVAVAVLLAFVVPMSTAYALWSRTASASLNVTVQQAPPAAPTITCEPRSGSSIGFTWPTSAGLTYTVHQAALNLDAGYTAGTAPSGSGSHVVSPANPSSVFYRVKASDGSSTSGWSNTVRISRAGGASTVECVGATP